MTSKLSLLLILFSIQVYGQAYADSFSTYTAEMLKKVSDAGCLRAYYSEQKIDFSDIQVITDSRIMKCTNGAARLATQIMSMPIFPNSPSSEKVLVRMQAYMALHLCEKFTNGDRNVACLYGGLKGSMSRDLNFINNTSLMRTERLISSHKPDYIYINKQTNKRTDSGNEVYTKTYNKWIQILLNDYINTVAPNAADITNKYPDVITNNRPNLLSI